MNETKLTYQHSMHLFEIPNQGEEKRNEAQLNIRKEERELWSTGNTQSQVL